MDKTAIQTSLPEKVPPLATVAIPLAELDAPTLPKTALQWALNSLKVLASLRLTVVLFVLSMILVFFGTLAQMEAGIWTVVNEYFRSFYVWIPFQLLVRFGQVFLWLPKEMKLGGSFPFPGGLVIGGLLLVNLLAAHAVRFKFTLKRSGIMILHAGLIVMMGSEIVTYLFAVESKMVVANGETVNFVDVSNHVELAITDPSDPKEDSVTVIPDSILKKGGVIQNDALPVDVEVIEFMKNSNLVETDPAVEEADPVELQARWVKVQELLKNRRDVQKLADSFHQNPNLFRDDAQARRKLEEIARTSGVNLNHKDTLLFKHVIGMRTSRDGGSFGMIDQAEEKGVDTEQREDAPAAIVVLRKKGTDEKLGTFAVSLWYYGNFTQRLPHYQFPMQHFTVDGKTYNLELRLKRIYKPYSIHLNQFHHSFYEGTTTPKDFSSDVRLLDNTRDEDRELKIYMNNPLRYSGETFYQSGFLQGDRGTILQVVRNPGWLMPYISCILVTVGMLIHFGIHLLGFLQKRAAA